MNTIQAGNITRELPSEWNELTRKQLVKVATMFRAGKTVVDFSVNLLYHFMDMGWRRFRKISPEDVYYLCETLNFLMKDVRLTKNLQPWIRVRWRKYYGPDDGLKNITFGEFIRVQMAMEAYGKTKKEEYLNDVAGTLYRPGKFGWWFRKHFAETTDRRRRFLDKNGPKQIRIMERMDAGEKYGVMLFVTGVLNSMPDIFPNVYRKKAKSQDNQQGWIGVIISLADGKTDDESLDRIYRSNVYNVFYGLEKNAIEYYKMEKDHPELFKNEGS